MPEISLLICVALVFFAYTHAYYYPELARSYILFVLAIIAAYGFWHHVRDEVIARVMEKVEAVKVACRRAEHAVAVTYDSIAGRALAVMEKVEALKAAYRRAENAVAQTYYDTTRRVFAAVDKVAAVFHALYDIPRPQKFLLACIAGIAAWIVAYLYAWYIEDNQTTTALVVVPCGILCIALGWSIELLRQHEIAKTESASSTALVTYTPPAQPEIPARPETPAEKRSRERAAKHEANQVQLRRSWQKEQEQKKWEDEHRDGLGRAPLSSVIESSPRCSDYGVHYPEPIVFPEDRPECTAPKPQQKVLPPPPEPPVPQLDLMEPEREVLSDEDYHKKMAEFKRDNHYIRTGEWIWLPWELPQEKPQEPPQPQPQLQPHGIESTGGKRPPTDNSDQNPRSPKSARTNPPEGEPEPMEGIEEGSDPESSSQSGAAPSGNNNGGNGSSKSTGGSSGHNNETPGGSGPSAGGHSNEQNQKDKKSGTNEKPKTGSSREREVPKSDDGGSWKPDWERP